ncbi:hypothetical protein [Arthrobacter castelli]|uniref:hypothetical protein n=1 Tax=Arthrobacter castelli TaxID=271431 RepID=UPI000427A1A7|nr:hypothetical protein [Arthrobacter castelli]
MINTLPELWIDWCQITNTDIDHRDEAILARFARQACPPRTLLKRLRPEHPISTAPAWPAAHHQDATALERLISIGSARINDPDTGWVARLRLRRLLFAAVLIAPAEQGGLALTRRQALDLTPQKLQKLRPELGHAGNEAACPACAVWSWCHVLGTNNVWSHASVRELGHRRDAPGTEHRHVSDDPDPDWLNCTGVLSAIDRWGYIDLYASMHPSSLSIMIGAIATMVTDPVVPNLCDAVPRRPVRHITAEEETVILNRADELNARIAGILDECG